MPLQYQIHPDHRLVHVVGRGKVDLADLLANLDDLARDEDYRPPMRKLIDYRDCEPLHLTAQECVSFTDRKRELAESFRQEVCAILVREAVDFGMGRMHGMRMEDTGIDTNTFLSLEKALEWLQVEIDPAELEIPR